MHPCTIDITLSSRTGGSSFARKWVDALLKEEGVSCESRQNIETVLGEVVGNVERHAPGDYMLHIEVLSDRLFFIVRDFGPGFDLCNIPAPGTERNGRFGGYGLVLVYQICQNVAILPSKDGTTVSADIYWS